LSQFTDSGRRFKPGRYIELKFNNEEHYGIKLDEFLVGEIHLNENGSMTQDYKSYSESGYRKKSVIGEAVQSYDSSS
jgi:hypothetical protein